MIVDTGCQKLVAGTNWTNKQIESLHPLTVIETKEKHLFRFGASVPTPSLGRVRLPCGIAGHVGELSVSRVSDDVPGLLSQAVISYLSMVIDVHQASIYIGAFTQTVPLFPPVSYTHLTLPTNREV